MKLTNLMSKNIFSTLLGALVLLLVAGTLQSSAQKRWDELEFREIKAFNKPDVEKFTLNNGIRVYLLPDHELPLVTLSVTVRTGGILEPAEKYGLASLTGSVMRTGGTEKYPADELDVLLADKAAYINTGIGFNSGSASLNTLKEDFSALVPVFLDVITNPAFPEDRIELAKRQNKTGISRRNDDPQSVASREFNKLIYGESIYTKQTEYATVDNISRQDMIDFHKKSFVGANMYISVTGDFDTATMRKLVEEQFSKIPQGTALELTFPEVPATIESSVNIVDKKGSQQSVVYLGHEGGRRMDPDYAALQVMNQVLSNGFSGRLMQKVRTELGLAYAVFGGYSSNLNYNGTFYTGVMTKTETTAQAIDAIKGEIVRLQNEAVSEEELNRVKDQFLNSLVFRYTSRASVLNEQVSNEFNNLPPDLFDQFIEQVKAVTPADIQAAAQKRIRLGDIQILVVGDKQEIGTQLDKYGTVNEIDITIPEPVAATTTVTEDSEGKEWLNRMAAALIDEGASVSGFEAEGKISQTNMAAMDINVTVVFPDAFVLTISSPMGSIQQELKNGVALIRAGENEQDLGAAGVSELKATLDSHYLAVARSRNALKVSFDGMENVNSKPHAKITVNAAGGTTFWIDAETHLPVRMALTRFAASAGMEITSTSDYSEWKTVDGVRIATKTTQTQKDIAAGETVYTTVKIIK